MTCFILEQYCPSIRRSKRSTILKPLAESQDQLDIVQCFRRQLILVLRELSARGGIGACSRRNVGQFWIQRWIASTEKSDTP